MDENNPSSRAASKSYHQASAPWQLAGKGIIVVYKFSKKWVETFGQLPPELIGKFKGDLGYLILANQKYVLIGPYCELLFIPGKFFPHSKQSITKIYVDSEASTQNGRANWGIPKNTLPFSWEEENGKSEIKISSNDQVIFPCEVKAFGIPFPASTYFLPIDLQQVLNNVDYFTKPTGSGWGKLAKVKIKEIDTAYFPDLQSQKALFAVKIHSPIQLGFILRALYPEKPFRLIGTASAMSFCPIPGYSLYFWTKSALLQRARTIWSEKTGNWVTLAFPIATDTKFVDSASNNIPKAYPKQTATWLAKSILLSVARKKRKIFPSKLFLPMLFISRFFRFLKKGLWDC